MPLATIPYQKTDADCLIEVDKTLPYNHRGKAILLLTLYKSVLYHEAKCETIGIFLDEHGIITAAFHSHVIEHNVYPELH